jgi:hypothetical protein
MKDNLRSMDLFRCESATLRSHWVLVVMDQYTRRIIGFGVHAGTVDGVALCRMFNCAIRGHRWLPKYLTPTISGPTSTTIARIPHWKGERRLRRCHDQSQISARFDGSPTADPCIRVSPRLGLTSASGQPLKTPGMKSCGVCDLGYRAFRGSDRFTATGCVPKARTSSLAQRDYR